MKRSDFLKSLSALPLGIFAGNEIVKSIGSGNDNDQLSGKSTIDMDRIKDQVNSNSHSPKTINRPDLIDTIIKSTRGTIGNTNIYKQTRTPSMLIEYQGKKLTKIGKRVINNPSMFGKVSTHPLVVKTRNCRGRVNMTGWSDREVVKIVYDDIVHNINNRKFHNAEPDILVLYDIMITTPIYSPDFEALRGVMTRGAFLKF